MARAYQVIHLHLACATPNLKVVEYLSQTEEGDKIWYTEFPEVKDGMWSPYPDRPGLGLELDPTAMRHYSVEPLTQTCASRFGGASSAPESPRQPGCGSSPAAS